MFRSVDGAPKHYKSNFVSGVPSILRIAELEELYLMLSMWNLVATFSFNRTGLSQSNGMGATLAEVGEEGRLLTTIILYFYAI